MYYFLLPLFFIQGLREGFKKKKKSLEISHWGGGFLKLSKTFPNFFYLFLNMVWIIQKCKEIFFQRLVPPPHFPLHQWEKMLHWGGGGDSYQVRGPEY